MRVLLKESAAPLYYQVKQFIIDQIKTGNYPINQAIPTESELQQMLLVSRTTVRQAINELVTEGYLFRKRGVGTFVSDLFNKPKEPLANITLNTSQLIFSTGRSPRKKIIKIGRAAANTDIAAKLQISPSTPIWIFHRVEYGNDIPLSLTRSHTPVAVMPNFRREANRVEEGFHTYLESLGYPIRRAESVISASLLTNPYEIEVLKMKAGDPIFTISSVNSVKDGTPVEYSVSKINGNMLSIPVVSILE